jgi:transcription-repair coupling factor (superfamily II helicase)
VAKVDSGPELTHITFLPHAPVELAKIIELVQKNKHIKLAGNDKLRIERACEKPKQRSQLVREVLQKLGQPITSKALA